MAILTPESRTGASEPQPKEGKLADLLCALNDSPSLAILRRLTIKMLRRVIKVAKHNDPLVALIDKVQRPKADISTLNDRHFQNPTSLPSSSGSTSSLNKLFDKYKGTGLPVFNLVLVG